MPVPLLRALAPWAKMPLAGPQARKRRAPSTNSHWGSTAQALPAKDVALLSQAAMQAAKQSPLWRALANLPTVLMASRTQPSEPAVLALALLQTAHASNPQCAQGCHRGDLVLRPHEQGHVRKVLANPALEMATCFPSGAALSAQLQATCAASRRATEPLGESTATARRASGGPAKETSAPTSLACMPLWGAVLLGPSAPLVPLHSAEGAQMVRMEMPQEWSSAHHRRPCDSKMLVTLEGKVRPARKPVPTSLLVPKKWPRSPACRTAAA